MRTECLFKSLKNAPIHRCLRTRPPIYERTHFHLVSDPQHFVAVGLVLQLLAQLDDCGRGVGRSLARAQGGSTTCSLILQLSIQRDQHTVSRLTRILFTLG